MKRYVIQAGDTLYKISKKSGVRMPLLLASNPQITDPNQLQPGTAIVIPELGKPLKKKPEQTATTSVTPKGPKEKVVGGPQYFGFVWPHVVKEGETLEKIGEKHGLSVEHIGILNPLKDLSESPVAGSILYLPYMISGKGKGKGQGMAPPAQMFTTGTIAPDPGADTGPHSHMAHRDPHQLGDAYGEVPPNWDRDLDESSSLLSSWDAWDNAMRGEKGVGDAGSEGWSETLSIRHDEDD